MLEVEVMRQDGRCAPDTLLSKHWQHLMGLESKNQRSKYLLYLFKTEKSKENEKVSWLKNFIYVFEMPFKQKLN